MAAPPLSIPRLMPRPRRWRRNKRPGDRTMRGMSRFLDRKRMNTQLIKERLHHDRQPFIFRLSDGTRVRVAHPDFVAISPGQVVVIGQKGGITRIDPLHVVALEKLPPGRSKAIGKRK